MEGQSVIETVTSELHEVIDRDRSSFTVELYGYRTIVLDLDLRHVLISFSSVRLLGGLHESDPNTKKNACK